MYAVIETGGKQYRVELGTELAVERLDANAGDSINFDRVLLVADGDAAQIGTPTVADALVTADVLRQDRGEKIIVFKYRPKARHRAKKGHRQEQTVIRVADIRFNGRSAADEAGAQQKDRKAEQKAAQAEADKKAAADQALAAKLAADAESKAADDKPTAKATTRKPAAKADSAKADAETTDKKPAAKTASKTPAKTSTTKAAAKPAADETAQETPKASRARSTSSSTKKDE